MMPRVYTAAAAAASAPAAHLITSSLRCN